MLRAAEVLTLAAVRTMEQPELIAKAREELLAKNGGKYRCPLPDYTTPPSPSPSSGSSCGCARRG